MPNLKTTLCWVDGDDDREVEATVSYDVTPGYPQTWEEPGCETSVEITGIAADGPVPAHFIEDPDLLAECLADWIDDQDRAADDAADRRREELRDDRNQ
jgi:hypothetical protein